MSVGRRVDQPPKQRPAAEYFDRQPPFDLQAEIGVLGSVVLLPDVLDDVVLILRPDDFYDDAHRRLFGHMCALHEASKKIDPTLLIDRLKSAGEFELIGGSAYLSKIINAVPNAAHATYYAEIVRQKSTFRSLIIAATEILRDAYDEASEAPQLLSQAEQKIFAILDDRGSNNVLPLKDVVMQAMDRLDARMAGTHAAGGCDYGFRELDGKTGGLHDGELVILAARPSMGKCLSADAEIVLADGSVKSIEEIFKTQQAELLTLQPDLKLGWTRPSAFVDDGIKPVYRVTTRLGRTIKTTLSHPFLTIDGWRKLGELSAGDSISTPRHVPAFGTCGIGEDRAALLGYLLGDGGLTNRCPRFTNSSALLRDDFRRLIEAFGGLRVRENSSGGKRTITLSVSADRDELASGRKEFGLRLRAAIGRSGSAARTVAAAIGVAPSSITQWCQGQAVPTDSTLARLSEALATPTSALLPATVKQPRKNRPNRLSAWLTELGLSGCGAAQKFIPAALFRCPKPELASFLNRLFATDGWATVLTSGQAQLGYCTVSERLARQVQHLLLRFGVIAALKRRSIKYKTGLRRAFQLDITDADAIRTFIDEIGIFGKEEAVARVRQALDGRRYQTNRDLIPVEVWRAIDHARGDRSWRSISAEMGYGPNHHLHAFARALSRSRLWQLAQVLHSESLKNLATSDVYWDEIISIDYVGDEQVYDLTVPVTHNFIANDVCVHNTAFAMNVAEKVAHDQNIPVLFVSLEMSSIELADRLLCSVARVNGHRLRNGTVSQEDRLKLVDTASMLSKAPFFVDDSPSRTVTEIAAAARRIKRRQGGLGLIVIDYLQLIEPDNSKDPRQEQVAKIARRLKGLAREMSVPVMCLAQLNRQTEMGKENIPRLSHLRESGAIEQDADVVLFVHREEYYHRGEDQRQYAGQAQIICAKQRNGPVGEVELEWLRDFTRFQDRVPDRLKEFDQFNDAGGAPAGF
jgi:replicative DNA helicase